MSEPVSTISHHHGLRRRTLCWVFGLTLIVVAILIGVVCLHHQSSSAQPLRPLPQSMVMPPQSMVTLPPVKKDVPKTAIAEKKTWHPRHQMKVWTTRYGGASYRVIQLPRCEHLETVITYTPNGETFQQAKTRIGGIAVMSGSFHHPQSFSLADLLQREGTIANPAMTKRYFLVISAQGIPSISGDYAQYLRKPGVSMIDHLPAARRPGGGKTHRTPCRNYTWCNRWWAPIEFSPARPP